MLHTAAFRDRVLVDPVRAGADQIKIVSGYATHTMASWHLKEIESRMPNVIKVNLIVGMCRLDGISISVHNGFKSLNSTPSPSGSLFSCQYVTEGPPVHSKLYLWEKEGAPFCAYIGSANYTQAAFSPSRRELLHECDPGEALNYFNDIESKSMFCNHIDIEENIRLAPTHHVLSLEEDPVVSVKGAGIDHISLSLLTRHNDVGYGSGINWAHRRNGLKRELNQAYISLPSKIAHSGFFPLGERHFSVLTDDGKQLIMRVEQANDKAITTPLNNSLLGEYLRCRIGLPSGAFVTKQDLLGYGRTDVTFYKLDDEQYIMDFSV